MAGGGAFKKESTARVIRCQAEAKLEVIVPNAFFESFSSDDAGAVGLDSAAGAPAAAPGVVDGACATAWRTMPALINRISKRVVIKSSRTETHRLAAPNLQPLLSAYSPRRPHECCHTVRGQNAVSKTLWRNRRMIHWLGCCGASTGGGGWRSARAISEYNRMARTLSSRSTNNLTPSPAA